MDMFSLNGKSALITGATGVLGSSMAKGLAVAGVHVILVARKAEPLHVLAKEINSIGGVTTLLQADVTKEDDLNTALNKLKERVKVLDILVNATGGNQPGAIVPEDKTFFDIENKAIRKVIDLNYMGTVLPTKVFATLMKTESKGSIINIAFTASFRPLTRVVGYVSAKAPVVNFTQWLAVEMALKYGEGIRVNAIAPGFFLNKQNKRLLTQADGSLTTRGKKVVEQTPFIRFGKPEELIGTLIWLSSDASKFITGTIIHVDGGFNAYCGV